MHSDVTSEEKPQATISVALGFIGVFRTAVFVMNLTHIKPSVECSQNLTKTNQMEYSMNHVWQQS